ncbi:MAG TPA: hypothetical protein VF092_01105 [Longimicrobium sp.]
MEPQENKQISLQKAVSAHEQAAAALMDLMAEQTDPVYAAMLERIEQNLRALQADAAVTDPAEKV